MGLDKYMYVAVNRPVVGHHVRLHYSHAEVVEHVSQLKHELAREALKAHGIENAFEVASIADLPALTDILNHYIVHTPINFDVEPYTVDARRGWFDEHASDGKYRLVVLTKGYTEYKAISSKYADGYYGWEQEAPFDKIIVTCGIDHIPPPLLQQLKPDGLMVIPVGPPGAQRILKVVKETATSGQVAVRRSDIYNGRPVPFVPFTKLDGDSIKGTH